MTNSLGLPERYTLLSKLGTGGMGVVYKAIDSLLDKPVAIKVLNKEGQESSSVQRFQREAKALGKLRHKNLVTVLDFGLSQSGNPYLVMDFVEGVSLQEYLKKRVRLDPVSFKMIFTRLARAMQHSHENGVIHRDLKPSNVVLSFEDENIDDVKIIDFGIALLPDENESKLTRPNALVGSPMYMSPEQVKGGLADERSDVYSLGCMMYECLTGTPPYKGDTAMATMNMHVSDQVPSLEDRQGEVVYSDSVKSTVEQTLQKEPDDRHQSMRLLADALEQLFDEQEEPSQSESNPFNQTERKEYKFIPIFVIVCVTLLSIAGLVLFIIIEPEQKVSTSNNSEVAEKIETKSSAASEGPLQAGLTDPTPVQESELPKILEKAKKTGTLKLQYRVVSRNILKALSKEKFQIVDLRFGALENNRDMKLLENCGIISVVINSPGFNDVCAEELAKFPQLTKVEANRSSITDKGVSYLARIKDLDSIELDDTMITDKALKMLSGCRKLRFLQVANCEQISDTGIGYLKSLNNLETLDVRGCKNVTSSCVVELQQKLPTLENVLVDEPNLYSLGSKKNGWIKRKKDGMQELMGYNVTDTGLEKVNVEGINLLTLNTDSKFTGVGFKSLKAPELIRIKVTSQNFGDRGLQYLSTLPSVNELYLRGSSKITEKGIRHLAHMKRLTRLSFRNMTLSPNVVKQISRLDKLESLDFGYTKPITDQYLIWISNMSNLDDLSLSGTDISDSQIPIICKMNIVRLSLHRTGVTADGLMKLSELKSLKRLKLSDLGRISDFQFQEFRKRNPRVVLDFGLD